MLSLAVSVSLSNLKKGNSNSFLKGQLKVQKGEGWGSFKNQKDNSNILIKRQPHGPPKNREIALNTRVVKCKNYVSQKQNAFNSKNQWYNIVHSLLYLNSRPGLDGLKYLYSVISVIDKRLPGNTKKRAIASFVDDRDAISRILGRWDTKALQRQLKRYIFIFERCRGIELNFPDKFMTMYICTQIDIDHSCHLLVPLVNVLHQRRFAMRMIILHTTHLCTTPVSSWIFLFQITVSTEIPNMVVEKNKSQIILHTPRIHQIQKLRFLGISRYKFKLRFF